MRPGPLLLLLLVATTASADVVVLQNGRRIEVDRAWYEGAEVRYRRDGGTYGLPRSIVRGIEQDGAPGVPAVASPPPVVAASTPAPRQPLFRLRYEGGLDEKLGMAVLDELTRAHESSSKFLGFRPEEPITVVLQLAQKPPDGQMPGWAEGFNDGAIRVPVMGVTGMNARLVAVLRHELAHSFVNARTGGNCPTWLHEGIAQWLEGGPAEREDAAAGALAKSGKLRPLLTLEVPFQRLPDQDVAAAYSESLSAVAHILRLKGPEGLGRLLAALGDGHPSDEALPIALRLSYPEFQKSWESYLAGNKPTS